MKKKFSLILFLIVISLVFNSCTMISKKHFDAVNYLGDIKSYTSDMVIDVKNRRQVIEYNVKVFYSVSEGYRVEIGKDRVYIYNKDKVYVSDIENGTFYVMNKDEDNVFKYSFIQEFLNIVYTDEKVDTSYVKENNKSYQVISAILPGSNRNMYRETLYFLVDDKRPEKAIVYNTKDEETIEISYKNFKANANVDKKLFKSVNK